MKLEISSCVIDLIQSAAANAAPREACGLLFGTAARIHRASVARNVADDPHHHFELDPAALFAALRAERAGGDAIAGHWHSHPSGGARPSVTDAAMAIEDGVLWLIAAGDEIALWRSTAGGVLHGRFDNVPFDRIQSP